MDDSHDDRSAGDSLNNSQAYRSAAADESAAAPGADKRTNLKLRELIDEMMASIRTAARRDLWSVEERAQYEDELASIMQRVRGEAVLLPERRTRASKG